MHFTTYITWFKIKTYKDTPMLVLFLDIALTGGIQLHITLLRTSQYF